MKRALVCGAGGFIGGHLVKKLKREENEATQELLRLPGFEDAFRRTVQQADAGQVVSFESIRRSV